MDIEQARVRLPGLVAWLQQQAPKVHGPADADAVDALLARLGELERECAAREAWRADRAAVCEDRERLIAEKAVLAVHLAAARQEIGHRQVESQALLTKCLEHSKRAEAAERERDEARKHQGCFATQYAEEQAKLARVREVVKAIHSELDGFLPDDPDEGWQPAVWCLDQLAALAAAEPEGGGK